MKIKVDDNTKGVTKVFDNLVDVRKFTRLSMTAINKRLAGEIPIQSPGKPVRYIITNLEGANEKA